MPSEPWFKTAPIMPGARFGRYTVTGIKDRRVSLQCDCGSVLESSTVGAIRRGDIWQCTGCAGDLKKAVTAAFRAECELAHRQDRKPATHDRIRYVSDSDFAFIGGRLVTAEDLRLLMGRKRLRVRFSK